MNWYQLTTEKGSWIRYHHYVETHSAADAVTEVALDFPERRVLSVKGIERPCWELLQWDRKPVIESHRLIASDSSPWDKEKNPELYARSSDASL